MKKICFIFFISIFIAYSEDKLLRNYFPKDIDVKTITIYEDYDMQFNENCKFANWTIYRLTKEKSLNNFSDRKGFGFIKDKNILLSPNSKSYDKSNFDRGHLVPAEDQRQNAKTLYETFYTINICPQLPQFNRGIWKKLEDFVRYLVEVENRNLIIITGPVIYEQLEIKTIGEDKIVVPHAFFKIIYDYDNDEIFAYLIPHTLEACKQDLDSFKTNIDIIQKIIGYNFFNNIKEINEK